ncbi:hypothetical protein A4X13_0g6851 [Tilletia indica]|uniref:Uncharacterized protein n=1 Tax=Tilletia indica TaxID=43049 RepID=A0A177TEK4_9BASI|nr:hypothetical protein A4X13_0g6851 [Tilletia indica]
MTTARGDASTYTTFCETFYQIPVIQVCDLDVKVDYIKIDTLVTAKDDTAIDAEAQAYWKSSYPEGGSLMYGPMMVAVDQSGPVFYLDRPNMEVRPGNVEDPGYRERHISHSPLHIRALGKVVRKDGNVMAIKVETYIATGKVMFEIRFHVPDHMVGRIPIVGAYAGGRGRLLSVIPATGSQLGVVEVEMDSLHVGVMRSNNVRNEESRAEWIRSLKAKDPVKNSKGGHAKLPGPSNVNSTTTFCEAYHRFMVISSTTTSNDITVRTVGKSGQPCDFAMVWPFPDIPVERTIFSMIADVSVQNGRRVVVPLISSIEVRPGHPGNANYFSDQILSGACGLRAAGKVVQSSNMEFTVVGCIDMHGKEMPFQVRFLVPSTERWKSFKGVIVGQFISARGVVSSMTDGTNATIIVDLDQLTNPAIGQIETPNSTAGTLPAPSSGWSAPSSNTAAPGNHGNVAGPTSSTAITQPEPRTSSDVHPSARMSGWNAASVESTAHDHAASHVDASRPDTSLQSRFPVAAGSTVELQQSETITREKGKKHKADHLDGGRAHKVARP